METKQTTKICIKLESFNSQILIVACQKILNTLNGVSLNSMGMITLPTKKRIYCVLRSPHVDKDSREHFEIRIHKRVIEINCDSEIAIFDILASIDLSPGIFYRICLF